MQKPAVRGSDWLTLFEIETGKGRKAKRIKVEALFDPPSRAVKRAAQHDAARAAGWDGAGDMPVLLMAERGVAYGESIIRYCLRGWRGIGAEGAPTPFTPDMVDAFIADERLYDAAYMMFVLPELIRDAEKNGLSPSPNGTGAGATAGSDTVN